MDEGRTKLEIQHPRTYISDKGPFIFYGVGGAGGIW